jgi:hypothetical protein
MSRWKRPLKAAEVRTILKNLGFSARPTKATGHSLIVDAGLAQVSKASVVG